MDSSHSRCGRFTGKSYSNYIHFSSLPQTNSLSGFSSHCLSRRWTTLCVTCMLRQSPNMFVWSICFVFKQIVEFQRFRYDFFLYYSRSSVILCSYYLLCVLSFHLFGLKYIKSDYRVSKESKNQKKVSMSTFFKVSEREKEREREIYKGKFMKESFQLP